jgi:hypothetical protein
VLVGDSSPQWLSMSLSVLYLKSHHRLLV